MRKLFNAENDIDLLILELKKTFPSASTVTSLLSKIVVKAAAQGIVITTVAVTGAAVLVVATNHIIDNHKK